MPARSVTARFQLVTPAFASGADQACAELRIEAIVGQLRRWWWAQAPLDPAFSPNGKFNQNKTSDFADALFGAAGTENGEAGGGQGAFLITLRQSDVASAAIPNGVELENLFGPLWGKRRQWLWRRLPRAAPTFELGFLLRPRRPEHSDFPDNDMTKRLHRALALWGLLGGIGAGQRRGFGSVRLTMIDDKGDIDRTWQPPQTVDEYKTRIEKQLPGIMGGNSVAGKFASFASNGHLAPAIWMAEVPDCTRGIAALEFLQKHLSDLRDHLDDNGHLPRTGMPPRKQYPINVMSNQQNPRQRQPSPFHFHIARLDQRMAIILSVLPRGDYDPGRTDWIIPGRAAEFCSLAERLRLQHIL